MKPMSKQSKPVILRKMTLKDYDTVITLWKESSIPYRPQGRVQQKKHPTTITTTELLFFCRRVR